MVSQSSEHLHFYFQLLNVPIQVICLHFFIVSERVRSGNRKGILHGNSKKKRASLCHLTQYGVSEHILGPVTRFYAELEQTERETEKEGANRSVLD